MDGNISIICSDSGPILNELDKNLRMMDVIHHRFYHDFIEIDNLIKGGYKGFFIIALNKRELPAWQDYIQKKLKSYFKLYYYDSLIIEDLDKFFYLDFDFFLVGDEREKKLERLVHFLLENYWKKIPYSIITKNSHSLSTLFRSIIFTCEIIDLNHLNIEYISNKLKVSKNDITKEIKKTIDVNFREFKNLIRNYYLNNHPDHYL